MAVEARQVDAFWTQNLSNKSLKMDGLEGNVNVYGNQGAAYGVVAPLSGVTSVTDSAVPMYCSGLADNGYGRTAAMKSDSGLTRAVSHVTRKRSRDAISPMVPSFANVVQNPGPGGNNRCGQFSFLGEDVSFQILQQQVEVDRFIYQHMEKVRVEMEERRRRYSRRIAAVVEENVMKKLKAKDEEIEKMGKLNWALEEKVKSLCVENQIWRDLAQTNEATANSLRCDLEQVLTQVQDELQHEERQRHLSDEAALVGDAESCCDCNYDEIDRPALAADKASSDASTRRGSNQLNINGSEFITSKAPGTITGNANRICRSCARNESSVLLLPCRHLCLCTDCCSFLHTCPVCNSIKTASLHVNLSS